MKALLLIATTVGVSVSTLFNTAAASPRVCRDVFAESARPLIRPQKASALEKWQRLNSRGDLDLVARETEVTLLLNDLDLSVFGERLEVVMDSLLALGRPVTAADLFDQVRVVLAKEGLPSSVVEAGIREMRLKDIDALYRLLGNLTFKETREMYLGVAKGLEFTKDSILGRYLQESGATFKKMPLMNVVDRTRFTEERLVVAVSAQTFPLFMKYFSGRTVMSVLGHAAVFTNGWSYPHYGARVELRAMSPQKILPILILKPSEGERLTRYMELSASAKYNNNWNHPLKQPWLLDGYSAVGGYTCCTHWIGNLPIGDKPVMTYSLPGRQVYDAATRAYVNEAGPAVPLKPWKKAGYEDLQQVWKVPGNEQLSSVIGQLDKNVDGEFASPGYVIQTLFGPTSNERVPIVFYFVNDHLAQIADNPELGFERPH